jgi:glutamate 5-kinase
LLVLLTNVDGIYGRGGGKAILLVDKIDEAVEELALPARESGGKGGMASKLQAAKMATRCGIDTVVANGRRRDVLQDIYEGKRVGTFFAAHPAGLVGRKRWLAFGREVKGRVIVNEGARSRIIRDGKSLLPVGVIGVEGKFAAGEMVALLTAEGKEFARGTSNYDWEELTKIMGLRSEQISALNEMKAAEVIHRDNMVVEVTA